MFKRMKAPTWLVGEIRAGHIKWNRDFWTIHDCDKLFVEGWSESVDSYCGIPGSFFDGKTAVLHRQKTAEGYLSRSLFVDFDSHYVHVSNGMMSVLEITRKRRCPLDDKPILFSWTYGAIGVLYGRPRRRACVGVVYRIPLGATEPPENNGRHHRVEKRMRAVIAADRQMLEHFLANPFEDVKRAVVHLWLRRDGRGVEWPYPLEGLIPPKSFHGRAY